MEIMPNRLVLWGVGPLLAAALFGGANRSYAKSYGIELQNTLMPASGGMAGASLARPQDFLSAINGNPATMTDFDGTQFSFGGAWAEATYNVEQSDPLPLVGVDPFSAKSSTPGSVAPNIGVTQDLSTMGLPVVWGMGLFTNAGAGADFRGVPSSNGTNAYYMALDFTTGLGVAITERLSLGASMTLGTSFLDGPFVDIGGMTPAYGLRGTLGATYDVTQNTTVGAYWQTKKHLHFDNAVEFRDGTVFDLAMDHPENVGVGIANNSLMDGRLLLAMDVLYKNYSDADFLGEIYDDQWIYQFGMQYTLNPRTKLRLGYGYNENPMADAQVTSIGGVPLPDGVPALRYIQGQFAAVSQHRFTAGVGRSDVLPGIDVDLLAGGMFEGSDTFASTFASVESYWIGAYFTWRFGCCSCR
jgi:long-chain fatty acid transport protein